MEKLNVVEGLKKGDIVKVVEVSPIWNGEKQELEYHTFESLFRIDRVNSKTYTCTYTDGYMSGSGFKWIKGYSLEKSKNKEYFLV